MYLFRDKKQYIINRSLSSVCKYCMVYQQLQHKATIEHLDRTPRYDHIPLFCYLDICIDDLPSKIEGNFTFHSKPLWHSAKDADTEAYKRT